MLERLKSLATGYVQKTLKHGSTAAIVPALLSAGAPLWLAVGAAGFAGALLNHFQGKLGEGK